MAVAKAARVSKLDDGVGALLLDDVLDDVLDGEAATVCEAELERGAVVDAVEVMVAVAEEVGSIVTEGGAVGDAEALLADTRARASASPLKSVQMSSVGSNLNPAQPAVCPARSTQSSTCASASILVVESTLPLASSIANSRLGGGRYAVSEK